MPAARTSTAPAVARASLTASAPMTFLIAPCHSMLALRARLFTSLYLLSGAAARLYEVAWLRLLTLSMGHTTAAVGAVLAAFMGGLAAGAWIGGRVSRDVTRQGALRTYAALETAIALCALAMPLALGAMRPLLAWAYADGSGGALFGAIRFIASVVLIALPAAAMGASFPIGVVAVGDREGAKGAKGAKGARGATGARGASEGAGSAAAELYAANTIGAAVGAALTGFVLLPSLGLFGTTLVGLILNLVAATGALALSSRTPAPQKLSHPRTHPSHPSD